MCRIFLIFSYVVFQSGADFWAKPRWSSIPWGVVAHRFWLWGAPGSVTCIFVLLYWFFPFPLCCYFSSLYTANFETPGRRWFLGRVIFFFSVWLSNFVLWIFLWIFACFVIVFSWFSLSFFSFSFFFHPCSHVPIGPEIFVLLFF